MRSRGLVAAVALLMAATATLAVFLYLKGVRDQAASSGRMVEVIVSREDILAGEDFDELIASGAFTTRRFLEDSLVDGVVTDLGQLQGRRAAVAILAYEQISTARLEGSEELPGGALGIPKGHEAVTVALDMPRVVGGAMAAGDNVNVYASFTTREAGRSSITVDLLQNVQVLRFVGDDADGDATVSVANTSASAFVTLALKAKEALDLVYAMEHGTVYVGLLPPGEIGRPDGLATLARVVR